MKRINLNRIYFEYIQSPLEDSLAKLSIYLKNDRVDIFDRRFIKMGNPKLPTKLLSACNQERERYHMQVIREQIQLFSFFPSYSGSLKTARGWVNYA